MLPSLKQAIEVIRRGDKKMGRAMLADIIQADWENETAWLWMSGVVDSDAEKRRCLQRVLDINPDNAHARRGLTRLGPGGIASVVDTGQVVVDEPVPPDDEEPTDTPTPASLAERLASLPPVTTDVDTTVLGRSASAPDDTAVEMDETVEFSPDDAASELPVEAMPPGDTDRISDYLDMMEVERSPELASAESGEFEDGNDILSDSEPDEVDDIDPDLDEQEYLAEEADDEQAEAEPVGPSFWQTGRGAALLSGLVILILLCVTCIVAGLVLQPYLPEAPATISAALGTATATNTPVPPTPTGTPVPTATPTHTASPTLTPSATSTPVVADTATPTPTQTRTPTPVRGGDVSQVLNVIAADEIEVLQNGESVRVKYLSVVAPVTAGETAEPFGAEAMALNRSLVEGQVVRLERDRSNTDAEGRLLRYVYVGEIMVNEALVEQGLARVALVPPDTKYGSRLQSAEQEARLNRRGIWSLQ
jgi:endonuclease YncB( thermonuclease family)